MLGVDADIIRSLSDVGAANSTTRTNTMPMVLTDWREWRIHCGFIQTII